MITWVPRSQEAGPAGPGSQMTAMMLTKGRYAARIAQTAGDLQAAQALRHLPSRVMRWTNRALDRDRV